MYERERYGRLEGPRWEFDEWDERYPARLRDTPAHPDRVYVLGNPDALRAQSVSIVGARKATPYGIACAELSARCAASVGVAVVSGAAMGCDQASQAEALRQGCVVSAVLGTGADVAYPRSSQGLLERIVATGGAVVSLQPWGSAPTRWSFVRRNAVIAGLSEASGDSSARRECPRGRSARPEGGRLGMPVGRFSFSRAPYSHRTPRARTTLLQTTPTPSPVWDRTCLEVAQLRHLLGGSGGPKPLPREARGARRTCRRSIAVCLRRCGRPPPVLGSWPPRWPLTSSCSCGRSGPLRSQVVWRV